MQTPLRATTWGDPSLLFGTFVPPRHEPDIDQTVSLGSGPQKIDGLSYWNAAYSCNETEVDEEGHPKGGDVAYWHGFDSERTTMEYPIDVEFGPIDETDGTRTLSLQWYAPDKPDFMSDARRGRLIPVHAYEWTRRLHGDTFHPATKSTSADFDGCPSTLLLATTYDDTDARRLTLYVRPRRGGQRHDAMPETHVPCQADCVVQTQKFTTCGTSSSSGQGKASNGVGYDMPHPWATSEQSSCEEKNEGYRYLGLKYAVPPKSFIGRSIWRAA